MEVASRSEFEPLTADPVADEPESASPARPPARESTAPPATREAAGPPGLQEPPLLGELPAAAREPSSEPNPIARDPLLRDAIGRDAAARDVPREPVREPSTRDPASREPAPPRESAPSREPGAARESARVREPVLPHEYPPVRERAPVSREPAAAARAPAAAPPSSAPAASPPQPSASGRELPAASAAREPATPAMDRDFILRNQIIERYLSGKLPVKGASEFERFCATHPQMLDELGLPERVHAGLRLLEASGKPEPWSETPKRFWEQPLVPIGLAAAVLVLLVMTSVLAGANSQKAHRIATLIQQVADQPLEPATTTRTIRLLPSREGASNTPAVMIGGGGQTQLADFKIDMTHSPGKIFRVTIDRLDQGRVAVLGNLLKDSNGHLRIALNSSALGPGVYQLTIERLDWRGEPEPDAWVTIGIQH